MSGQHVGRRVIVKGHGPGTAIAWTDSPCYLVELDDGLRMMVGVTSVRPETIDDYIAAVVADPEMPSRVARSLTPNVLAMTVLNAIWEQIDALDTVDRESVAALLNVKGFGGAS